jgi:hypothetical protein
VKKLYEWSVALVLFIVIRDNRHSSFHFERISDGHQSVRGSVAHLAHCPSHDPTQRVPPG